MLFCILYTFITARAIRVERQLAEDVAKPGEGYETQSDGQSRPEVKDADAEYLEVLRISRARAAELKRDPKWQAKFGAREKQHDIEDGVAATVQGKVSILKRAVEANEKRIVAAGKKLSKFEEFKDARKAKIRAARSMDVQNDLRAKKESVVRRVLNDYRAKKEDAEPEAEPPVGAVANNEPAAEPEPEAKPEPELEPMCPNEYAEMDAWHNWPSTTDAESAWAVKVLQNLCRPNTLEQPAWTEVYLNEDDQQILAAMWVPGMTTRELYLAFQASLRDTDGRYPFGEWADGKADFSAYESCYNGESDLDAGAFASLYFNHQVRMKNAIDQYVIGRMDDPDATVTTPSGMVMPMRMRYDQNRSISYFQDRGRRMESADHMNSEFARDNSFYLNKDAGTSVTPRAETKNFFGAPVQKSGKLMYARDLGTNSRKMQRYGLPAVAGASGTMQMRIMTMEENVRGAPRVPPHLREALIIVEAATLTAGGMHALAECLMVAQAFGYFKYLPQLPYDHPEEAYDGPKILAEFEAVMEFTTGITTGGAMPLNDFFSRSFNEVRKPSGHFAMTTGTTPRLMQRSTFPPARRFCEEEAGIRHSIPCACNTKSFVFGKDCRRSRASNCCCTQDLVSQAEYKESMIHGLDTHDFNNHPLGA